MYRNVGWWVGNKVKDSRAVTDTKTFTVRFHCMVKDIVPLIKCKQPWEAHYTGSSVSNLDADTAGSITCIPD